MYTINRITDSILTINSGISVGNKVKRRYTVEYWDIVDVHCYQVHVFPVFHFKFIVIVS